MALQSANRAKAQRSRLADVVYLPGSYAGTFPLSICNRHSLNPLWVQICLGSANNILSDDSSSSVYCRSIFLITIASSNRFICPNQLGVNICEPLNSLKTLYLTFLLLKCT